MLGFGVCAGAFVSRHARREQDQACWPNSRCFMAGWAGPVQVIGGCVRFFGMGIARRGGGTRHVLLLAAFLAMAVAAFANIYGAVRGVVHDPQHRPIEGAMVMLKAKSSDWAKSVTTDASGEFEINAVPLGDYSVAVASPGFAQAAQDVT